MAAREPILGHHKYHITEGISGMWHYHITNARHPTKSLCGRPIMTTSMGLDQWKVPFGKHLPKQPTFCEVCDREWARVGDPKMDKLMEEGNILLPKMVNGSIVALHRYAFTVGLIIGVGELTMCERRYCFQSWHEALYAYSKFDDVDKHAEGPWIKCKGIYKNAPIDMLNPSFGKEPSR